MLEKQIYKVDNCEQTSDKVLFIKIETDLSKLLITKSSEVHCYLSTYGFNK